jgi:hypothetical protein
MSPEDGQFPLGPKKRMGMLILHLPKNGPLYGQLPIFEFESVFLIWHNLFFSFIGVGVTLEVRVRPC